jgi:acetyl-CoA C-acetyltransferase
VLIKASYVAEVAAIEGGFAGIFGKITSAELIEYEAMGLTASGEGERAIHEGWVERDGKLPINVSGGLKAKGHPVGATGVSMHVMSAMQLSGTASARCSCPRP